MSTTIPPLNALIWISVKPIIKLAIPAFMGYGLTKADLYSSAGSRATSQIIMRVTLPALLFSKLVVSFTSDNVSAMGPIFVVALFYQGLSFIMGAIVRFLFPLRRDFRYGILAAATWSNWGDLPTAVVSTITMSQPFNGTTDSDLSIAYVAIFILVSYVTLFPMGGIKFIQWDYTKLDHEDPKAYEMTEGFNLQSTLSKFKQLRTKKQLSTEDPTPGPKGKATLNTTGLARAPSSISVVSATDVARAVTAPSIKDTSLHNRRLKARQASMRSQRPTLATIPGSRAPSMSTMDCEKTVYDEPSGSRLSIPRPVSDSDSDSDISDSDSEAKNMQRRHSTIAESSASTITTEKPSITHRILRSLWQVIEPLLQPPTLALILGLLFALVPQLKALMVHVDGTSFNPVAPDGEPPLSVFLQTADFLGAASVPLGLIVLGSAMARLTIPRPFSALPIRSIVGLAMCKMMILPVIGFFFVRFLTQKTSLVAEDNFVLRFVLVFFSCVPSATSQVVMTQLYCPDDVRSNEDMLASYLIVQYMFFAISSVFLTVFTLKSLY